jgi:hypothetical protein
MPQPAIGKCLDFGIFNSFEDEIYLVKLANE